MWNSSTTSASVSKLQDVSHTLGGIQCAGQTIAGIIKKYPSFRLNDMISLISTFSMFLNNNQLEELL